MHSHSRSQGYEVVYIINHPTANFQGIPHGIPDNTVLIQGIPYILCYKVSIPGIVEYTGYTSVYLIYFSIPGIRILSIPNILEYTRYTGVYVYLGEIEIESLVSMARPHLNTALDLR